MVLGDGDGDLDLLLNLSIIRPLRLMMGGDSDACWDFGSPEDCSSCKPESGCSLARPPGGSPLERRDFRQLGMSMLMVVWC